MVHHLIIYFQLHYVMQYVGICLYNRTALSLVSQCVVILIYSYLPTKCTHLNVFPWMRWRFILPFSASEFGHKDAISWKFRPNHWIELKKCDQLKSVNATGMAPLQPLAWKLFPIVQKSCVCGKNTNTPLVFWVSSPAGLGSAITTATGAALLTMLTSTQQLLYPWHADSYLVEV